MSVTAWKPGTLYIPGSLVIPTVVQGASQTVIPNADFESGDTDWTKGTGWAINTNDAWAGTQSAEFTGTGTATLVNSTKSTVAPGKSITAAVFIQQGAGAANDPAAAVILEWYDAGDVLISTSTGNNITDEDAGVWKESTVSATAPSNAAKVSIGVTATGTSGNALYVDNFRWNYVQGSAADALVYKSVGPTTGTQTYFAFVDSDPDTITRSSGSFITDGFAKGQKITVTGSTSNDGEYTLDGIAALTLTLTAGGNLTAEGTGASVTIEAPASSGTSGATEPTWPASVGSRVLDNGLIWEAIESESITWEASSILTSGNSEPTWPTESDAYVSDNNIAWKTVPLRITDENCPHSKVVAIAASKVFAGDTDVVRFCATLNARDWSTTDDAGFLPTGLQQKSQVGVEAMGVYRGNLAVWSGSTFQVWQVDPDPAAMALLDAMEGIGSLYQQAVQPVSDDLFFLSALGVRTVSIAEGNNNLATGDVGVPIDVLVQDEKNQTDVEPVATYFPSAGQYWLAFRPKSIIAALLAGQFLLTSTPYPIEASENVSISCELVSGDMRPIETLEIDYDTSFQSLTLKEVYLDTDVEADYDTSFQSLTLSQLLLDTDIGLDELDYDSSFISLTLESKLVSIFTPDEGVSFECELVSGECSMDSI
jgi:hypothetical protein